MNKVISKADSIEEMAVQMKVPKKILKETLETYNHYASEGKDPLFGKALFTQTIDRPLTISEKKSSESTSLCGGIKLNKNAEVVSTSGSIIPGLYVCGEASGGPSRSRQDGRSCANVRICFQENCRKAGICFPGCLGCLLFQRGVSKGSNLLLRLKNQQ